MRASHQQAFADLPAHWGRATLGEIAEIRSGSTPKREVPAYWGGSIAWVTPGELTGLKGKYVTETAERITDAGLASCATKLLPKDALLVTTRATLGAAALAGMPVATNQGFRSLVFGPGADPHFFFHLASRLSGELRRRASGTTFLEISGREFAVVEVPVPPVPEQRRIAGILDTLDEAIRGTEQLIAKFQRMKHGLVHDLLTRGVDDNGELRDPEHHPEQFKDSRLGPIPRQWDAVRLGVVVPKAEYGISLPLYDHGDIPILRMMNLDAGEASLSDLKYSDAPEARALLLQPGDVLFNRTNSIDHVGRSAIWRGQHPAASFASYLVRLVPTPDRLAPEFFNRWLNWEATRIRIKQYATPGVHQVNINPTNLRRTQMAIPGSLAEQEQIAQVLLAHDESLSSWRQELWKLRALKVALADDLLTGRVRVPIPVEAAP